MLIDSHHHLWKYSADQYGWINNEMSVLKRDFLGQELRQVATESGVDGFVSVQARQTIGETEALLEIARTEPLIKGVVGWVPLADPQVESALERFAGVDKLKGVRHVVQSESDDRFLLRPDFNHGVTLLSRFDLVYDVLIFAKQLPAAIEFVDHHQDLTMVLDHIAKPTIQSGEFDQVWEEHIRELALRDNVVCKFSGVVTEVRDDSWDIETIRRYWDVVLDAFTPKRLMFGSDWPVCLLKTGHRQWLDTVRDLASKLSDDEQHAFFAGNATKAYNL